MKEISVQELKTRIESGEKLNVIDVREEWEYEEFNIGARNIPLSVFMSKIEELENLKTEEVIIHCKAGVRSGQAVHVLQQFGFTNVKNLSGGLQAWQSHFGAYSPQLSK
ncbi:MAG: rhodanese-like domain-containing protein [Chitinophagales bacterium]